MGTKAYGSTRVMSSSLCCFAASSAPPNPQPPNDDILQTMGSKGDDCDEERPMLLPAPEGLMKQVDGVVALKEKEALPHKERANELYQAHRFQGALEEHAKALHCFSIHVVTLDKMANGLLLGTISNGCGADSPAQILGGAASPIAWRIASFLVVQPHFFIIYLPLSVETFPLCFVPSGAKGRGMLRNAHLGLIQPASRR